MSQKVNWTLALNLKHKDFLKTFLNSWTDTDMTLMNASVSPWNLLMPFLIMSNSVSLLCCLLLVTRVCLLRFGLMAVLLLWHRLAVGGGGGGGEASTGEPLLCFIASHCRVGRLQPSSLVLMGVGVLFLQWIYEWVGHCDLQSCDTVFSSGPREADFGSLCVFQVSLRSVHHLHTHTYKATCAEKLSCALMTTHTHSFHCVMLQGGCYCCISLLKGSPAAWQHERECELLYALLQVLNTH